jgi:hypothetical protein
VTLAAISRHQHAASIHCPLTKNPEKRKGRAVDFSSLTPRVRNPYSSANEQGKVNLLAEHNIRIATPAPRKFSYQSKSGSEYTRGFITAIHIKGISTLPSNYRLISLTCTACKIIEAIIEDQRVTHLPSKGLISRQQHAFIRKHSTVINLLQCTHDWALAVHGGHSVDTVYNDFARAFDSVRLFIRRVRLFILNPF